MAKKAEAGSHAMDKEGPEPCAAGKSAIEDVAGNLLGQVITADEPVESNNNHTNVTIRKFK